MNYHWIFHLYFWRLDDVMLYGYSNFFLKVNIHHIFDIWSFCNFESLTFQYIHLNLLCTCAALKLSRFQTKHHICYMMQWEYCLHGIHERAAIGICWKDSHYLMHYLMRFEPNRASELVVSNIDQKMALRAVYVVIC